MSDQSKPLSAAELEALREMEAKATKGPWEYQPDPDIVGHKEPDVLRFGERYLFVTAPMQYLPERDWRFIAAMRNALPALLRVAEAAKAVMDECEIISSEHSHEDVDKLLSALAALEVPHA